MTKKLNILYVYRGNTQAQLFDKNGRLRKDVPDDFLYGMNHINDDKYSVSYIIAPRASRVHLLRKLLYPFEKRFTNKASVGFPLELLPMYWKELRRADVIIGINDAISVGLMFWKKLGLIPGKVVVLMQSLTERKQQVFPKNNLLIRFFRWLLSGADVVMTLSNVASDEIQSQFEVSPEKSVTFRFGVDAGFWKAQDEKKHYDIVSYGNDLRRDYETLISAVKDASLLLITKHNIPPTTHVTHVRDHVTFQTLRKLASEAKLAVVPSIYLESESSGLSSALQLYFLGLHLILPNNTALREVFGDAADYYEPGNSKDLSRVIAMAFKKFGQNDYKNTADKKVLKFTSENMARQLENLLV